MTRQDDDLRLDEQQDRALRQLASAGAAGDADRRPRLLRMLRWIAIRLLKMSRWWNPVRFEAWNQKRIEIERRELGKRQ